MSKHKYNNNLSCNNYIKLKNEYINLKNSNGGGSEHEQSFDHKKMIHCDLLWLIPYHTVSTNTDCRRLFYINQKIKKYINKNNIDVFFDTETYGVENFLTQLQILNNTYNSIAEINHKIVSDIDNFYLNSKKPFLYNTLDYNSTYTVAADYSSYYNNKSIVHYDKNINKLMQMYYSENIGLVDEYHWTLNGFIRYFILFMEQFKPSNTNNSNIYIMSDSTLDYDCDTFNADKNCSYQFLEEKKKIITDYLIKKKFVKSSNNITFDVFGGTGYLYGNILSGIPSKYNKISYFNMNTLNEFICNYRTYFYYNSENNKIYHNFFLHIINLFS